MYVLIAKLKYGLNVTQISNVQILLTTKCSAVYVPEGRI
jgi:hypothetical protein